MKLGLLMLLACTLLSLSACLVEPYGRDRGYYRDGDRAGGDRGGYHEGDRSGEDYGRRVWRE